MGDSIKNIIIFILIGIVGYQYFLQSRYTPGEVIDIDGEEFEIIEETPDTVYIETMIEIEKYIPVYQTVIDTFEVVNYIDVDTAEILKDYFRSYTYIDTLELDGLGYGYVTDVITKNRIDNRSVLLDYTIPTITNTIVTRPIPKNEFFIGPEFRAVWGELINSFGGSIILKSKRDYIYKLSTGVGNVQVINGTGTSVDSKIRPYLGVGYYWKITN